MLREVQVTMPVIDIHPASPSLYLSHPDAVPLRIHPYPKRRNAGRLSAATPIRPVVPDFRALQGLPADPSYADFLAGTRDARADAQADVAV